MATLTAGTFLIKGTTSGTTETTETYTKLVDISDYPQIGSNVDTLDVTTLTDACHKYIENLPDPSGSLEFSGFLNDEDYDDVMALAGQDVLLGIAFGGKATAADSTILEPDTITRNPATGVATLGEATWQAIFFTGRIRVRIAGAGTAAAHPVTYTVTVMTGYKDKDGNML